MKRMLFLLLITVLSACSHSPVKPPQPPRTQRDTYRNEKFSYQVSIPGVAWRQQPASRFDATFFRENGHEQIFLSTRKGIRTLESSRREVERFAARIGLVLDELEKETDILVAGSRIGIAYQGSGSVLVSRRSKMTVGRKLAAAVLTGPGGHTLIALLYSEASPPEVSEQYRGTVNSYRALAK